MITKTGKELLKKLRKLTDNSEEMFWFYDDTMRFGTLLPNEIEERFVACSEFEGEIYSIIDSLIDNGYIKTIINDSNYQLTQKAIHYEFVDWYTKREFILCNIIVPIIVSLITTLITIYTSMML